jgi:hypothetical protein
MAMGVWLWSSLLLPALIILSAGLGLVLGAFGSLAVVKYKEVIVGGAAAIAIIFASLMYKFNADDLQQFINVELTNLPAGSRLTIGSGDYFHTKPQAEIGGQEQYEILVPSVKITKFGLIRGSIEIQRAVEDCRDIRNQPGRLLDSCVEEIIFTCINAERIKSATNAGVRHVRWSLDRASRFIINDDGERIDGQDCDKTKPRSSEPNFGFIDALMGTAWAEGEIPIDELLKLLESESTVQRRASRDVLSGLGEKAVVPLLQALAQPQVSYRTRLGVCVALAEFLRDHKDRRKSIAALISLDDLGRLLDAAADPDRTIRIYASEFLYDLGDPRSVLPALERIEAANDNGKYNLLLVVKGSIGELGGDDRIKAKEILALIKPQVGEKTSYLVDQILAIGTPQEIARYWVIVGSFKDEESARNFVKMIASEAPDLKPFVGKPAPDDPFYPVIVGDFVDKAQAEKLREAALNSKMVTDAYLSDYPYKK